MSASSLVNHGPPPMRRSLNGEIPRPGQCQGAPTRGAGLPRRAGPHKMPLAVLTDPSPDKPRRVGCGPGAVASQQRGQGIQHAVGAHTAPVKDRDHVIVLPLSLGNSLHSDKCRPHRGSVRRPHSSHRGYGLCDNALSLSGVD
jgi:hypothetical protein